MLPRDAVPETYPPTKPIPTDKKTFEYFAAFVWGSVMWLFAERRQNLQAGLVNSMDCECRSWEGRFFNTDGKATPDLYVNAEKWNE